jgi:hypothetical protein
MKSLQIVILVLLGLLLVGTFIPTHAHMTKAYVGIENNQFIDTVFICVFGKEIFKICNENFSFLFICC